ncbi:MAG: hypothetical protein IRY95_02650 [Clostridia bacterium]|nr:hypothetical protein [Clostridia bacterium]
MNGRQEGEWALNLRGYRLPVVLAAFVAGVALLFGGQRLYEARQVDAPLQAAFDRLDVVESFAVRRAEGGYVIEVTLKDVPNLREAYLAVDREAAALLGRVPYHIVVRDRRDPALVDAFYRLHYAVEEAIATGRFTVLADNLSKEGARLGLDRTAAWVDERFVYLQLHRGDHYLYDLRPRQSSVAKGDGEA